VVVDGVEIPRAICSRRDRALRSRRVGPILGFDVNCRVKPTSPATASCSRAAPAELAPSCGATACSASARTMAPAAGDEVVNADRRIAARDRASAAVRRARRDAHEVKVTGPRVPDLLADPIDRERSSAFRITGVCAALLVGSLATVMPRSNSPVLPPRWAAEAGERVRRERRDVLKDLRDAPATQASCSPPRVAHAT